MICKVITTRKFEKQFKRVLSYIQRSIYYWMASVEDENIHIVRHKKAYHDEPLHGEPLHGEPLHGEPLHGGRKWQRSIRLSRAYRLIHEETKSDQVVTVRLLEVHKHEY